MKNLLESFRAVLVIGLFISSTSLSASANFSLETEQEKHKLLKSHSDFSTAVGFLENKGQIKKFDGSPSPDVKFIIEENGTQIFLLNTGIAYQFSKNHYPDNYHQVLRSKEIEDHIKLLDLQKQVITETYRMNMTLVGANLNPEISTKGRSDEYFNYYNQEVLDVHHFQSITYHDVYPGVDWVVYLAEGNVKYDFVLNAGVDPSVIQIEFTDTEDIQLREDGSLILENRMGSIIENKPVSYQNGMKIQTEFVLEGNRLTFNVDNYSLSHQLVIDPEINWSSYYGGSGLDHGVSVKTDNNGNIFISGYTESMNGIANNGHQNSIASAPDGFLVKFNANGVRQWATYYGGSQVDRFYYSDIDSQGNVYVAGQTSSTSGIASGGHQNIYGGGSFDGFLVKFNTNGVRQWGTYYGGSAYELAYNCAVDGIGNVYLAGATSSSTGIASGGQQNTIGSILNDAFLVKFNSTGQRLWGTYFGGTNSDNAWACAVDASNNVYLAGNSNSNNGIAVNGHQQENGGGISDAFLTKYNQSGSLLWSTYYGGSGTDYGFACTTDNQGNVYLAGHSTSPNNISHLGHQMSNGGVQDGYLVKFNASGVRQWGTYYGGEAFDESLFCVADANQNVYVIGITLSTTGIAANGFQNEYAGGGGDGYAAMFSSAGNLIWGSYVGGSGYDALLGVDFDQNSDLLLAGLTDSNSGISTPGTHQVMFGGVSDAFLMRTSSTVSVFEQMPGSTFMLYPNPSSSVLYVESDGFQRQFQILSIEGRLVKGFFTNDYRSTLDVSQLKSGMYVVKCVEDGSVQKFIKQ